MIIVDGYTNTLGRYVDLTEDIRWTDTHWGKYSDGMANYLSRLDADEATGEDEWSAFVQRFGKRLLFSDDRGFVTVEKYASVDDAKTRFNEIDSAYGEWLDENEDV